MCEGWGVSYCGTIYVACIDIDSATHCIYSLVVWWNYMGFGVYTSQ